MIILSKDAYAIPTNVTSEDLEGIRSAIILSKDAYAIPTNVTHLEDYCVKVIMQIIRQKKGRSKRRKKYTDKEFDINDRLFLVALLMYTVAY